MISRNNYDLYLLITQKLNHILIMNIAELNVFV